jgi:hypothetical protein
LDRGYDKVIYISRPLIVLCEALALYFYQAKEKSDIIKLILHRPNFFVNIKRKWEKLEKPIDDPRFLKISLDDWNNFTTQTFDKLLDFLEFPKRNRIKLVPARVDRNWEGYSCSHLPKEHKICERVEVLRKIG